MYRSEKLGVTPAEKVVIAVIPLITAAIGYFLKPLVNLIEHVPFISNFQLVRLIHEFNAPWLVWVLTAVGLIAGIFISMITYDEILKLNIMKDNIEVNVNGKSFTIERYEFGAAFKEGKKLFIFSKTGRELLLEKTDYTPQTLKETFGRFNYQCLSQDPYSGEYFEWLTEDERLNSRANDVLYKRKEALREDNKERAAELKSDLDEMNIYVKDTGGKQMVRRIEREEEMWEINR